METTFGERLARAIKASSYDQQGLADELGVSEGQLSRWVNDRGGMPGGKTLQRLPLLLRVNLHWLLTGDGPPDLISVADARSRLEQIRQIVMKPPQDDDEHHAAGAANLAQPILKSNGGPTPDDAQRPPPPAKRRGGQRKDDV